MDEGFDCGLPYQSFELILDIFAIAICDKFFHAFTGYLRRDLVACALKFGERIFRVPIR